LETAPRRVLIYRLGSLGDMLVALPALHLVARAFPNCERRMLTNVPVSSKAPAAAAVLDGTGLVHGYFSYRVGTRTPGSLVLLWWQVARWRPDAVVYLAAFRGTESVVRDARFFRLCGVRRQIGVPLTDVMQKNLVQGGELEPEASRLARNLAELGEAKLDDPASWDLRVSEAEKQTARAAMAKATGLPVIAVSVGTKVQAKDWGIENWRALLAALGEAYPGHALALCGAKEEAEASEFAAGGWREGSLRASASPIRAGAAINLCGKLTPRESAAALAEARVFVGHDSGPMHLAAAVQTPCVAIFAARNKPRMWFPYGRQHRVVYHQVSCWGCGLETCVAEGKRCLTSITVHEVMAEIRALLG
jgi:ADP-heptose:LPS heptosyltransferase